MDEREFELINILGPKLQSNQRDLSRHLDLSLGMTNMLIKRLIEKGYIRIKQLNKKKFEYILTPKGFSEKMRKSVKYTLKTINSIGLIKDKLKDILQKFYESGERKFYIFGEADLVDLIEMGYKELNYPDAEIIKLKVNEEKEFDGILLVCKEKLADIKLKGKKIVNVVEEIAK